MSSLRQHPRYSRRTLFFGWLEHMREKPVHVRRRIALLLSGSLTALVFLMWLVSFTAPHSDTTKLAATLSPFESLRSSFSSFKESMAGAISETKESILSAASSTVATTSAPASSMPYVIPADDHSTSIVVGSETHGTTTFSR